MASENKNISVLQVLGFDNSILENDKINTSVFIDEYGDFRMRMYEDFEEAYSYTYTKNESPVKYRFYNDSGIWLSSSERRKHNRVVVGFCALDLISLYYINRSCFDDDFVLISFQTDFIKEKQFAQMIEAIKIFSPAEIKFAQVADEMLERNLESAFMEKAFGIGFSNVESVIPETNCFHDDLCVSLGINPFRKRGL